MKLSYLFIPAFAISMGVIIFGESGLISAYRYSQKYARLEARVMRIKSKNTELEARIQKIKQDPEMLEHTIRNNLSMLAPNEILYVVE